MPVQKLPMSKKNKQWRQDSVDNIIGREYIQRLNNGKTFRENALINYDLYNGIFDMKDLTHVVNPFGVEDGFPAKPQMFNIIRPKIMLLLGEETKRPQTTRVVSTNPNAVSIMQDKAKELLQNYVYSFLMAGMDEQSTQDFQQGLADGSIVPPESIQQYLTSTYKSISEECAYHTINYLTNKLDLRDQWLWGFEDALISGVEVYYVGVSNGEPFAERVNPIYFSFDQSPEIRYIEDGEWCLRKMWLTVSDIYDTYYNKLDDKQLSTLLELTGQAAGISPSYGQIADPRSEYGIQWYPSATTYDGLGNLATSVTNVLPVYHACWRSYKKIGFLTYFDEEAQQVVETTVDETYKPNGQELSLDWDWAIEVWEGYRVGTYLHFGIQPVDYQHISVDNPNSQKLPYTGTRYSYNNSEVTSLVDVLKPLQYMMIVLWYRLELAIAKDKGKVAYMDVTQIPKSMGISVEKWLHYLGSLGVAFINPYEEGWDIPGREGGKCFLRGTKVLMSDGKIKNIEDVKLGDRVMGPDGTARNVIELHSGTDHMYKITPFSGSDVQIVNSRHEVYYGKYNKHTGETCFETDTPGNLMLRFRNTPSCRDKYYLYRSNSVVFSDNDVQLDPYLLGLWIGDGSTNKTSFTTCDVEIVNYLNDYAFVHGMKCGITPDPRSKALTINLSGNGNHIRHALKSMGIFDSKGIPDEYVYTSEENRLQLLAGLLDTDGWYDKKKKRFGFCQTFYRKHIVDRFVFIARSLGMKVSVRHKKKPDCYVASILSGCERIPTKISRKKATGDKIWQRDINRTMFDVEYYGIDEYYGFTLDNDHLFLLSDFTICHNSATYNQFSSQDLSMSNTIVTYVELMNKIEEMAGQISGVTAQREGQVAQRELVGNVERSVLQSSNITERLYWSHEQCKKRVLTMLLDTAKAAWSRSDKKSIQYILSDGERAFIDIEQEFLFDDHDVFISDSTKELQQIETLKQLYQPAMQNGASLSDVADIMSTDSMAIIRRKLDKIKQEAQQLMQQQQKAEQETQLALEEMITEREREKMELERYKIDTETNTKLQIAEMQANLKYADISAAGVPNAVENRKLDIEYDKFQTESAEKAKLAEAKLQEQILKNRMKEMEMHAKYQEGQNKALMSEFDLETSRVKSHADVVSAHADIVKSENAVRESGLVVESKRREMLAKEIEAALKQEELRLKEMEVKAKAAELGIKINESETKEAVEKIKLAIEQQRTDDDYEIKSRQLDLQKVAQDDDSWYKEQEIELKEEELEVKRKDIDNKVKVEQVKLKQAEVGLKQTNLDMKKADKDMEKAEVTTNLAIKRSKEVKPTKSSTTKK